MQPWQAYLRTHRDRFLAELTDILRIPSVSGDPARRADVNRAARWAARRLSAAGLEGVKLLRAAGAPVVYGEWLHASGCPTVLIYGHFDVEPAGPPSAWTHPPFQPAVVNGRVYARGASDDKGNLVLPIHAVEALLQTAGALPVNVKFLLEGQEEIGSPDLPAFLRTHHSLLACDFALSADGGQHSEIEPALTLACRGLCALDVAVDGPAADLHSGVFGGAVQNPLHALARVLASLHHPDGRVAVPGFYELIDSEWDALRSLCVHTTPADEAAFLARAGARAPFGEPGYTTLERAWFRPTVEINGLWGGGQHAVLPARAGARLTCRLAGGQDPVAVLDLLEAHLTAQAPPGARVTVTRLPGHCRAYRMAPEHPANAAAADVLTALYGRAPRLVGMGATIPVCALLQEHLGVDTVQFAFGLDDENLHAPDEFFRLSSWERGQEAYCRLLQRLSQ